MHFTNLPQYLILYITNYLDVPSLVRFSQTSKHYLYLSQHKQIEYIKIVCLEKARPLQKINANPYCIKYLAKCHSAFHDLELRACVNIESSAWFDELACMGGNNGVNICVKVLSDITANNKFYDHVLTRLLSYYNGESALVKILKNTMILTDLTKFRTIIRLLPLPVYDKKIRPLRNILKKRYNNQKYKCNSLNVECDKVQLLALYFAITYENAYRELFVEVDKSKKNKKDKKDKK